MRKWKLSVALFALFSADVAVARVEHTLLYSKNQSYHAALRYLRIDHGYNVVEKDLDSGYLVFEYPTSTNRKFTSGSIEVIERSSGVALVVKLPEMPEYHERMLANGLLKKLRTDYGAPPEAKRPPPKEKPAPPVESPDDKAKVAPDGPPEAAPDGPPDDKKK